MILKKIVLTNQKKIYNQGLRPVYRVLPSQSKWNKLKYKCHFIAKDDKSSFNGRAPGV